MGRKSDTELMGGLAKRLEGSAPIEAVEPHGTAEVVSEPIAAPGRSRKRIRDELRFVGFHTTEEQKEKLRVLSFETRRQNQDLMREALDLLFKKYS